ncbi:hypothetical protein ACIPEN_02250 [Herbaspirillum chlorophenolicum]|uniref:Uncharacterized protein n=1 Tax=Herbaspirillum chlorophenolicum TaxID=211589 RepID=A0ABW8EWD7_9BURK|nr:hypothetical protein [Herbaspirillum chlorophenolicum]
MSAGPISGASTASTATQVLEQNVVNTNAEIAAADDLSHTIDKKKRDNVKSYI